jgi:hypothetical protein
MIALATLVVLVVLLAFAIDTIRNAPQTFTAMIVIGVLAVVLDAVTRRYGSNASSGEVGLPPAPHGT